MKKETTISVFLWLLSGPVLAFLFSFASRFVLESVLPGNLVEVARMVRAYPLGLLMSLLTPWGWLMYGGLYLKLRGQHRSGMLCTVSGAVLLGGFWPVWATFLVTS